MVDLEFLSGVDVCEGMNVHELTQFQRMCRAKTLPKKARVFAEGEQAKELAIIVEGKVDLRFEMPGRPSAKNQTLVSVGPGHTFGWSAFVPPFKYTLSSYVASDEAQLLFLVEKDLARLFEFETRLGFIFMGNMACIIGKRYQTMQDVMAREQGFDLMEG